MTALPPLYAALENGFRWVKQFVPYFDIMKYVSLIIAVYHFSQYFTFNDFLIIWYIIDIFLI